jgi:hypothetical protein
MLVVETIAKIRRAYSTLAAVVPLIFISVRSSGCGREKLLCRPSTLSPGRPGV